MDILTSLLTSVAVVGAWTFILKKYWEMKVKYRFEIELEKQRYESRRKLAELEKRLDTMSNASKLLLSERFAAYKEIVAVTSRCRNLAKAITRSDEILFSEAVHDEFHELVHTMTGCFENHRLLFGLALFMETLHPFQDNVVAFKAELDRLFTRHRLGDKFPRDELEAAYDQLNQRHGALVTQLQEAIESPAEAAG